MFCKQNNLISQGISLIEFDKGFSGQQLKKYIKQTAIKNQYLTQEEIYDVALNCSNAQDGIIPVLLFEGVSIQNNLIELLNLKHEDIDQEKGTITIKHGEFPREINVGNEKFFEALEDAKEQTDYLQRRKSDFLKTDVMPLIESEYVIRAVNRNCTASEYAPDPQLVRSRIKRLREDYDNHFLTATNLWISGQIHYAKELQEELEMSQDISELTSEHYKMINARFGFKEVYHYKTKERIKGYL